jgi:hypothetical protein
MATAPGETGLLPEALIGKARNKAVNVMPPAPYLNPRLCHSPGVYCGATVLAMPLRIEVLRPDLTWRLAGVLTEGQPPASVSDHPPGGGRDVIVFQCTPDGSTIWRLIGFDVDSGDGGRLIMMDMLKGGLEELAVLGPGDFYSMAIVTDNEVAATFKWTHIAS